MDEHTTKRLQNDLIAWLTTVSRGGQPQTSPVWFLLDDGAIWVYSLPDTARVRNIEANPKVSVNLDGNGTGGDIVTIEGRASFDPSAPAAWEVPDYVTKYTAEMEANGWTPEVFSDKYPVAIRIEPQRWRVW
ncbi:MAG: TIGR03667 family PPOX class F420-dependent oxidoreductase [Acidimicrobiia bacterium]|nr:TIGR03667 family PPOX class F420-dependent oxidoreductase [Acidimicrobiia bacterium]